MTITRALSLGLITLLVALLAITVYVRTVVSAHLFTDASQLHTYDAILILGASVVRKAPSPAFAARADAAIDLYQKKIAPIVLVSGASDGEYNEVEAMVRYLSAHQIPEAAIVQDVSGNSTYESIDRAGALYGIKSLVIPTQDFHLPRAVYIARRLGIDADGLMVQGGTFFDYFRELPATVKALIDVSQQ